MSLSVSLRSPRRHHDSNAVIVRIADVNIPSGVIDLDPIWAVEQRLPRVASITAKAAFSALSDHRANHIRVEVDRSHAMIEGVGEIE
jgi:hypothetical protein